MSELLVTSIYNQEGEGAPSFPKGATVTGVITATSFSGSGASLTGIDATALKDGSGNVKIQANSTGAVVTGILTATTGSFTGNVSVGGTLTYEDVTNIDSVGLITARQGIKVTGGDVQVGSAVTVDTSGINVTGVVTATSFVGNGANLTNLPPGGNTFTGIASGSMANNKCAMVCHDGKLMEVSATISPASTPTSVQGAWLNSNSTRSPNTVWNPREKMVYIVWMKQTNGYIYVSRYVANTGTGGLTFQDSSTINTNGNTGNECRLRACYDTTNNHLIVMYYTGNTGGWTYRIGTPSGTNNYDLTWSSETVIESSAYYGACCWEPSTERVVTIYRDDGNGDDLYCRAGTVSGSAGSVTITWGSAVQLDGTNNVDGNKRLDVAPTYDGRVIYSWTRTNNATYTGAATINSNNSVTYISSVATLTSNGESSNVAYNPVAGKGVVTYSDATDSNHGWSRLITLSGGSSSNNVVTLGSAVEFKNSTYERGTLSWNAATSNIWGRYQSNGGSGATWLHMANISGSTLTWINAGQINGGSDSYGDQSASWNAADNSAANSYGYISIAVNRDGTNYGTQYTAKVIQIDSNITHFNQYVGFPNQAYTNSQTATINTYGNNVSTLSGLTPTSVYYVQADGTVGLGAQTFSTGTFPTNTPVAGTALNATTLLIRDPARKDN